MAEQEPIDKTDMPGTATYPLPPSLTPEERRVVIALTRLAARVWMEEEAKNPSVDK